MRIVMIGSGNTASVLARKIKTAGHEIIQVFSRQFSHAEELADELGCEATSSWVDIKTDAQLFIVAISDSAITQLSKNWHCEKGVVVHTAGAVSKEALQKVARNYGVLYPLQTLRKERRDYDNIPLLTDANNEDTLALLTDFAETISSTVRLADDAYRMHLHVAAVVVNNFTNHLYTLAESYCTSNGVSFALLKPLILETAERLDQFAPASVQTGPAYRGDIETVAKHLQLLQEHPSLLSLYQQLTKSIRGNVAMAD
ncbi:MAG: Rossmann-like and DUF2520 domain-containing protein [Bacteroidota bacterium]